MSHPYDGDFYPVTDPLTGITITPVTDADYRRLLELAKRRERAADEALRRWYDDRLLGEAGADLKLGPAPVSGSGLVDHRHGDEPRPHLSLGAHDRELRQRVDEFVAALERQMEGQR